MFFELFCLAVVLGQVENKDNINVRLPNGAEGFESVLKSWYPEDAELNVSCVSEGCPALNNFRLCHEQINMTTLHSVLKTATGCMRSPICGIHIDIRPIPNVIFTTEDWLPGLGLDGICELLPGEGHLSNVSNIEFKLLPRYHQSYQLPLEITMFIGKMRTLGALKLKLSLREKLPSILGPALSVTFPRIEFDSETEYVATISLNHSLYGDNFQIKVLNPIINHQPKFCDIAMPDGFPSVHSLLTLIGKIITENSSWAVRKAAFMTKYFQSVFDTVLNTC